jgi:hypothetical protein
MGRLECPVDISVALRVRREWPIHRSTSNVNQTAAARLPCHHVGPAFADERAPFLHKRMGFQDEEEIRLLNYSKAHKNALAYALTADDCFGAPPPPAAELPEHIHLGWNPLDVLDGVIVSPYATADDEQRVRQLGRGVDRSALRVSHGQFRMAPIDDGYAQNRVVPRGNRCYLFVRS